MKGVHPIMADALSFIAPKAGECPRTDATVTGRELLELCQTMERDNAELLDLVEKLERTNKAMRAGLEQTAIYAEWGGENGRLEVIAFRCRLCESGAVPEEEIPHAEDCPLSKPESTN